jgi:SOS-response transcriptional repressor LexA
MDNANYQNVPFIQPPDNVPRNSFGFRVVGGSMMTNAGENSFSNGTVVFAQISDNATSGDFVIVRDNVTGNSIFKQYLSDGNSIHLTALNPQFPVIEWNDTHQILGIVCSAVANVNSSR